MQTKSSGNYRPGWSRLKVLSLFFNGLGSARPGSSRFVPVIRKFLKTLSGPGSSWFGPGSPYYYVDRVVGSSVVRRAKQTSEIGNARPPPNARLMFARGLRVSEVWL